MAKRVHSACYSKQEKKKIDEAHKQELRSRQYVHLARGSEHSDLARSRGIYQSGVVRSTKWSKDGLKDRMSRMKNKMTGSTKTESQYPLLIAVSLPDYECPLQNP